MKDWGYVGKRLRDRRRELGLTVEQVAQGAKLSRSVITELEKGIERERAPGTLFRIALALRWDSDAISQLRAGREPRELSEGELREHQRFYPMPDAEHAETQALYAGLDERLTRVEEMLAELLAGGEAP